MMAYTLRYQDELRSIPLIFVMRTSNSALGSKDLHHPRLPFSVFM